MQRCASSTLRRRSLVLAGLLLTAPTSLVALGQEVGSGAGKSSQEARTEASREDSRTREATRLLHLRTGEILRIKSRWVGDHWEIRRARTWTPLPAELVVRAVRERDVEREAKKRLKAVDPKNHAGRVVVAKWMLDEGLLQEGVDELGRVLGFDPDQPQALELLSTRRIRLANMPRLDVAPEDLPEAREELLRFAAKSSPVGRELAVRELARLATTDERETLAKDLTGELFSSSPRCRAFATLALRRLFPGDYLRELMHRAVLDPSDEVRLGAALALRDADQVAVIVPVLRALGSSYPAVRVNAAQALGNMGYPAAVEPLMRTMVAMASGGGAPAPGRYVFIGRQFAYIQDFDVEVAQFQAVADPQVNVLTEGAVLESRIQGVTATSFASERSAIRKSLRKLTGQDAGNTTKSWQQWWEENKDKWLSKNFVGPPERAETTTSKG